VFGNHAYDGGIVYLSRFDQSKSQKKKKANTRGTKPLFQLLAASGPRDVSDSDDEAAAANAARVRETLMTVADQIYHFSLFEGAEVQIVREGAIKVGAGGGGGGWGQGREPGVLWWWWHIALGMWEALVRVLVNR
jgi:hypothetical protein